MADKRITDVDFIESLDGSESFFINQNSSIKQINKGKIIFDIANGGTGATDAVTARENLGITSENIGAQSKHIPIQVTLSESEWIDNKQTVTVSGVTYDNTIFIGSYPSNYIEYMESGIYCLGQEDNQLTFVCEYIPKNPIIVNVVIFG